MRGTLRHAASLREQAPTVAEGLDAGNGEASRRAPGRAGTAARHEPPHASRRVARRALRPAATSAMRTRHWPGQVLAGLGLTALALSGCQTWTSGMTLPT